MYPENEDHIFVNCIKVKEVRQVTNIWAKFFPESGDNVKDFLFVTDDPHDSSKSNVVKDLVKHAYFWLIWRSRNELLFKYRDFNPLAIANDIQSVTFLWFRNRCSAGKNTSWIDWCCNPLSL